MSNSRSRNPSDRDSAGDSSDARRRVEICLRGYDPALGGLSLVSIGLLAQDMTWLLPHLLGLDGLRSLDMSGNSVGPDGALAIARVLPRLRTLSLVGNDILCAGAAAIAKHLTQLRALDVACNFITDEGAEAISHGLPELRDLSMQDNLICPRGAIALSRLTHLRSLRIAENDVHDSGAEAIAQNLPHLHELDISYNHVHDASIVVRLCHRLISNQTAADDAEPTGSVPKINVSNNPLRWPGTETLISGTALEETEPAKLLRLLLKIRDEGGIKLLIARAVLAGPSMHGKTHLARRLIAVKHSQAWEELDRPIDPITGRTWGFDVTQTVWGAEHHGQRGLGDVLLRIVDCGGNLSQLQSHHNLVYLGSRRTVFIVCIRADQSLQENWADYHLGLIASLRGAQELYERQDLAQARRMASADRVPGRLVPVVLVATHADVTGGQPCKWGTSPESWTKEYPRLDIEMVDGWNALEGEPIEKLRHTIGRQISRLPELGAAVPSSLLAVRDAVLAWTAVPTTGEPTPASSMSLAEFRKLCRNVGQRRRVDQDYFLRELHNLGYIVAPECYRIPQARGMRILNPSVVHRYLHALQEEGAFMNSEGFISERDYVAMLDAILPGLRRVDQSALEDLIRVSLTAFEWRIDEQRVGWLVPDLLRFSENHVRCAGTIICGSVLRVRGFLAESVFFRFLADQRDQLVVGEPLGVYRDACKIRDGAAQAVIRFDVRGKTVTVNVSASTNQKAIALRDSLTHILADRIRSGGADVKTELRSAACRLRPGRPSDQERIGTEDRWVARWQQAKEAGTTKEDFCREFGIELAYLNKALHRWRGRHRKRRNPT